MRFLRAREILGRVLSPLGHALLAIRCLCSRYGHLRVQGCHFWGPKDFLTLSSKAMELLCESDSSLYSSLIAGRYVFWYEPTVPGPLLLLRHCAINKEYCAWKEHGIIAS